MPTGEAKTQPADTGAKPEQISGGHLVAKALKAGGIVAYPYTTQLPVNVLGTKYRWARAAGLL